MQPQALSFQSLIARQRVEPSCMGLWDPLGCCFLSSRPYITHVLGAHEPASKFVHCSVSAGAAGWVLKVVVYDE